MPLSTLASAKHHLLEVLVYPPLQHLFDFLSAVVVKTFQAQLLTGLCTSDKLPLNPQSPICDFLSAVVADFLFPYSALPK